MLCYRTNKNIRTHLVESKLTPSLDCAVEATPLKEFSLDYTSCHATDGLPKMGPPDHLWQIVLLWMVPPDYLWRRKWSPVATDGPP